MSGKLIDPLDIEESSDIGSLIENVFGASGFNGRRLAEAAEIWKRMVEKQATVCLTLAGAMTPIGMSGPVISLMKRGFVDFIISTGANLYHDLHRAYDYPVRQGQAAVDDRALHEAGVVRIYDTFIEEDETLLTTDCCIVEAARRMVSEGSGPISTADFHRALGQVVEETAEHPERSLLAQAAKLDVPIYCSALGDSSVGMNLLVPWLFDKAVPIDPVLDILETAAIVWASELNGAVEVGGGHPKNFYMQTQPTLWQILHDDQGGHDFFIQLTSDAPHWGGLSGATPSEAYSWGKVSDPQLNNTVVYSCASITFPLLASYMVAALPAKQPKRLMTEKDGWTEKLAEKSRRNEKVLADWNNPIYAHFRKSAGDGGTGD
jgi:deoxyhypusine synthase